MKLGRLLPGLGIAGLAVLVSLPVGAGVASAASAPPPAYYALANGFPLAWSGAGLSVGDLRVPLVSGRTDNTPVADANAALVLSDLKAATMSGEEVKGLTCAGFDEANCKAPFLPYARSERLGADPPPRVERTASFTGKDDKFPGRIHSLVECGDCAKDVTRSFAEATGASGGVETYFTIGGSSASQDLSLDDRGRVVSVARSSLSDVVIGPKGEVRFSRLNAIATAFGSGADNAKDGRAEVKVENFVILDNPVELTRAGLRLAGGGPSEQEAYDGAKALLDELKQRGITLGLPDFNAQVDRKPTHVTVQAQGLRVHFERSVQGPQGVQAQSVASDLQLGSTTALVAAADRAGKIEVSDNGVAGFEPAPAPTPVAQGPRPRSGRGQAADSRSAAPKGPGVTFVPAPKPVTGNEAPSVAAPSPEPGQETVLDEQPPGPENVALPDIPRALGLRDARSVSRAFGAFIGLGLILPIARLVIRRFG